MRTPSVNNANPSPGGTNSERGYEVNFETEEDLFEVVFGLQGSVDSKKGDVCRREG